MSKAKTARRAEWQDAQDEMTRLARMTREQLREYAYANTNDTEGNREHYFKDLCLIFDK